jgi:CRP/FNR family transcriptional regulator
MRGVVDGQLHMTQSELAAHLGTTREVIAKLLRKMVASKAVKTLRGSIVIENPEMLAKLAIQE